jgi:hypothetical protein
MVKGRKYDKELANVITCLIYVKAQEIHREGDLVVGPTLSGRGVFVVHSIFPTRYLDEVGLM